MNHTVLPRCTAMQQGPAQPFPQGVAPSMSPTKVVSTGVPVCYMLADP
jgi:hypothetical protein